MAIQMISDLPVFNITDKVTPKSLRGSYMELSYLSSDNPQTQYRSMAIPLGVLYQAILRANSGDTENASIFPEHCIFLSGMEVSGDVFVNCGAEDNLFALSVEMDKVGVSARDTRLSSSSLILASDFLQMLSGDGISELLAIRGGRVVADVPAEFRNGAYAGTTDPEDDKSLVTIGYLKSASGADGSLLFETKHLDYADDSLSSSGWLRLNADQWLLSADYPVAYDHLASEVSSISALSTDSYGSESEVKYLLAADGHKIVSCDSDSAQSTLDARSGVLQSAGCYWYYVLDTEYKRFKLPMTGVFFQSMVSGQKPGTFMKSALPMPPNHTHNTNKGTVQKVHANYSGGQTSSSGTKAIASDTTWPTDDPVYSKNTTVVQPPAILMETYMRCM